MQSEQRSFDIPAQPLTEALIQFGRQAGLQATVDSTLVQNQRSAPVKGTMGWRQALTALLSGTGLTYRINGSMVSVEKLPTGGDGSIQLNPVTVEGQGETAYGPVKGYVATRSATGTKTDTPLIEVPRSITVIGRQQMEAQGITSVQQALRNTPGVFAESSGVQTLSDNFYVRGFMQGSANPNMYLDGMLWVGSAIEPYGLERVEVLRGPASVLYGQTSPGGLVNQERKRPPSVPLHEVQVQGGNFDRKQGAFDLGGPIDGDEQFLYRLTGLLRDSETQIEFTDDDRAFISGAVTWQPTNQTSLTLFGDYQKDETQFIFGYPALGTIQSNPNGRIPNTRFIGEPGFDRFDTERVTGGYFFEHRFDDDWAIRQKLRYGHIDQDSYSITDLGFQADLRTINRGVLIRPTEIDLFTMDNNLEHEFSTYGIGHTALLGLDFRRQWQDNLTRSGAAPSLDLYAPTYGQNINIPNVTVKNRQNFSQVGLYGQDQVKIDQRWVLTLGGRHDWADADTTNELTGIETRQTDRAFTGQAGLVYLTNFGLAPYASYAESFLPVSGTDFGGSPFEPETGRQFEIGVKYEPKFIDAVATFSLYDLRRQNVTTPDPDHPGFNVQTGEVRARGAEVSVTASLMEGLNLVGAYTYIDAEVTKSNGTDLGKRPFRVPAHTASLWGDYTIQSGDLSGLGLGAGVRYVGASPGDSANTFFAPAYTLFDAAVHYQIRNFRFALNAMNLADKYYVAACFSASNGCNFGQARTILGTLTFHW